MFGNYRIVIDKNPDADCLPHLILCKSRLAGCAIRLYISHLYCILILHASLPPSVSQSPGLATTMSSSLFNLSRTNYLTEVERYSSIFALLIHALSRQIVPFG